MASCAPHKSMVAGIRSRPLVEWRRGTAVAGAASPRQWRGCVLRRRTSSALEMCAQSSQSQTRKRSSCTPSFRCLLWWPPLRSLHACCLGPTRGSWLNDKRATPSDETERAIHRKSVSAHGARAEQRPLQRVADRLYEFLMRRSTVAACGLVRQGMPENRKRCSGREPTGVA